MNDLAERQETTPAVQQTATPADMLQHAMDRGLDPESLQKFMDLYDRWEAKQAKAAFDRAMGDFKRNPPQVFHDLVNKQYGSTYPSLANLVNTVNAHLAEHGLNAAWECDQSSEQIGVTCVLSHTDGYEKRVTLYGPPDESGSKNQLQQIKSTITYLKAATFEAVTGIASKAGNSDDDGNSGQPITAEQAKELDGLLKQSKADRAKFLKFYSVSKLAELPASKYDEAKAKLNRKREENAQG